MLGNRFYNRTNYKNMKKKNLRITVGQGLMVCIIITEVDNINPEESGDTIPHTPNDPNRENIPEEYDPETEEEEEEDDQHLPMEEPNPEIDEIHPHRDPGINPTNREKSY